MSRNGRAAATIERERKFLVRQAPRDLGRFSHQLIQQGYLALPQQNTDGAEIRVRRVGRRYVLTVKKGSGESRLEREVPLPHASAEQLWPLTRGLRIKKMRYRIPHGRLTIELDVYRDNADGLMTAEVEFTSAAALHQFDPPSWFGKEITGQKRFANSQLARTGWTAGRRLRT